MKDKFPCTGCGACCKKIQPLKEFSEQLALTKNMPELAFPYTHTNGTCEKHIDNKCSIYDSRPIICNIGEMQKVLNIDTKAFYKMNADICNTWIKDDNIGDEFIINL